MSSYMLIFVVGISHNCFSREVYLGLSNPTRLGYGDITVYEDGEVKMESTSDMSDIYDLIGQNVVDKITDEDSIYKRHNLPIETKTLHLSDSALGAEVMQGISRRKRNCKNINDKKLLKECMRKMYGK